jgi:hypothetical protein
MDDLKGLEEDLINKCSYTIHLLFFWKWGLLPDFKLGE